MAMVMAMTVGVTVIVMTGIGGASARAGHRGVSVFVRVRVHRRKLYSTRSGCCREIHLRT